MKPKTKTKKGKTMRRISPYPKERIAPEYQRHIDQLDMRVKQVVALIEAVDKCKFLTPVEIVAFQDEARTAQNDLTKHLYAIKHTMEIDAEEWFNFFVRIDFVICKRLNWLRQRFAEREDEARRKFNALIGNIIDENRRN